MRPVFRSSKLVRALVPALILALAASPLVPADAADGAGPTVADYAEADRAAGITPGTVQSANGGGWSYGLPSGVVALFTQCDASRRCGYVVLGTGLGKAPLQVALELKRRAASLGVQVRHEAGNDISRPTPISVVFETGAASVPPAAHPQMVRAFEDIATRGLGTIEQLTKHYCFLSPTVMLDLKPTRTIDQGFVLVSSAKSPEVQLALKYLKDAKFVAAMSHISVLLPGPAAKQPWYDAARVSTDGVPWDAKATRATVLPDEGRISLQYGGSDKAVEQRLLAARTARVDLLREGKTLASYEFDLRSLASGIKTLRDSGFACPK